MIDGKRSERYWDIFFFYPTRARVASRVPEIINDEIVALRGNPGKNFLPDLEATSRCRKPLHRIAYPLLHRYASDTSPINRVYDVIRPSWRWQTTNSHFGSAWIPPLPLRRWTKCVRK